MRVLLDTHILLWALIAPKRLGKDARTVIESPDNDVLFSATSIWEIAIKSALKKMDFRVTLNEIVTAAIESGFTELPALAPVCETDTPIFKVEFCTPVERRLHA